MAIFRLILNNAAAVLFAAGLFVPFLAAADAGMVVVTAKGSGVTVAEAKKDAGRNAIQLVVGELLDAETLVENDELVKDRILTHSIADANGTVEADVEISVDATAWKDWAAEARLKLDKNDVTEIIV